LEFFVSSRRRHTRSKRDWSSDVCSSDLPDVAGILTPGQVAGLQIAGQRGLARLLMLSLLAAGVGWKHVVPALLGFAYAGHVSIQIGRASCRERRWKVVLGRRARRIIEEE